MGVTGLRRLQVWTRAKDFVLKIYKQVLPLLPAEEKWGLGQQLRRASVSIPANIAEGHGRFYYQDNVRFCYAAPWFIGRDSEPPGICVGSRIHP